MLLLGKGVRVVVQTGKHGRHRGGIAAVMGGCAIIRSLADSIDAYD